MSILDRIWISPARYRDERLRRESAEREVLELYSELKIARSDRDSVVAEQDALRERCAELEADHLDRDYAKYREVVAEVERGPGPAWYCAGQLPVVDPNSVKVFSGRTDAGILAMSPVPKKLNKSKLNTRSKWVVRNGDDGGLLIEATEVYARFKTEGCDLQITDSTAEDDLRVIGLIEARYDLLPKPRELAVNSIVEGVQVKQSAANISSQVPTG